MVEIGALRIWPLGPCLRIVDATNRDKLIPVKCVNFDAKTGKSWRPCKPGCNYTHPSDPGWSNAPVSRLALSKGQNVSHGMGPPASRSREGRDNAPWSRSHSKGNSDEYRNKDKGWGDMTSTRETHDGGNTQKESRSRVNTRSASNNATVGWRDATWEEMPHTQIFNKEDSPTTEKLSWAGGGFDDDGGSGWGDAAPASTDMNAWSASLPKGTTDASSSKTVGSDAPWGMKVTDVNSTKATSHPPVSLPLASTESKKTSENHVPRSVSRLDDHSIVKNANSGHNDSVRILPLSTTSTSGATPTVANTTNSGAMDVDLSTQKAPVSPLPQSLSIETFDNSDEQGLSVMNQTATPKLGLSLPSQSLPINPNAKEILSSAKSLSSSVSIPPLKIAVASSAPLLSRSVDPIPFSAITEGSNQDLSIQQKAWSGHMSYPSVLFQAVSTELERLRIERSENDRSRLKALIQRRSGLAMTKDTNTNAPEQIVPGDFKRSQPASTLKDAIGSLQTDSQSTGWWPTPQIGIDYKPALISLENDMLLLKQQVDNLNQTIEARQTAGLLQGDIGRVASDANHHIDPNVLEDKTDILAVQVREVATLVNNKHDGVPAAIRNSLYEDDSLASVSDEISPSAIRIRVQRVVELRNRLQQLQERLSGHVAQFSSYRTDERNNRSKQLSGLKARLSMLRQGQLELIKKYEQLNLEASSVLSKLSRPPLSQQILAITTDPDARRSAICELTGELIRMAEVYQSGDLAYMKAKQDSLIDEAIKHHSHQAELMKQRASDFIKELRQEETLANIDLLGQKIDRRWSDVTAIRTMPARGLATIRIPDQNSM